MIAMDDVVMSNLSWEKVQNKLSSGATTVILPIGASEQHGPHLPIGTDTMIGEELASRIAARLGDSLVAPSINVGFSPTHQGFPGTISIRPETLHDLVVDYISSFASHGFEYVVLLPSHGGNFSIVETVASKLGREYDDLSIIPLADLEQYLGSLNSGLQELEYEEPITHAGATETAAMLVISEALVNRSRIKSGTENLKSRSKILNDGLGALDEDGVIGDPTFATEQIGERVLESVVDEYVGTISHERDVLQSGP